MTVDMDISMLMEEWLIGFTSEGSQYKGLKHLEEDWVKNRVQYRVRGLRSAIGKRKVIASFIEGLAEVHGSLQAGINAGEAVRIKVGKNEKPCTLNRLYEWILSQQKK